MPAKKTAEATGQLVLQRLQDRVIAVEIRGLTPYIPHRWSEKAKAMMPGHPDKPQIKEKKGAHDPEAEAEACVYRLADGRPGIPATALKAAMVGACRAFDGVTMTAAKVWFRVIGEGPEQLVPFTGEPEVREDMPRNANGGADLRYRTYFHNWRATVQISYVESLMSAESIVALLDAGGRGGIGDWRPTAPKSSTGTFGMWTVGTEDES